MIDQPIPPKITWTNIGIDPPTIYLYFSSKLETENEINNIWIKLDMPFYTINLKSQWNYVNNCEYDISNMKTVTEERFSGDSIYSYFYLNLVGSKFIKDQVYILILKPDRYLDFIGYSEPIKISIISGKYDNHFVFAYNYSFLNLFSSEKPKYWSIINDNTVDINKTKRDTNFDSMLILQFPKTNAKKIIINVFGDYSFGDDAEIKCGLLEDIKLNIPFIAKENYTCKFTQELGNEKNKYLLFEFLNYEIPEGKYLAYFSLKSPIYSGSHSLRVYLMDQYGNYIYSVNTLNNIFKTVPSTWANNYPYIKFSFNFRADDEKLPNGVGLYSMSKSENQIFNSLVFYFRASDFIPRLKNGESYEIQIQLGANNLFIPLGYIHDNLDLANGFNKKNISLLNDRIVIKNIWVFNGKEYKISFKMGIRDPISLSLTPDKGFGYINLLYNGKVFFKSQAKMKKGFNNIIDNKSIRIPEDTFATTDLYFRGFSSFSSGDPGFLGLTAANYQIKPNRNGLRFGNNQYFYFQSSLGNNIKYFTSNIDFNLWDSTKSFIEVITDPAINSKVTNFEDNFANNNCQIYIQRVSKWLNQLNLNDIDIFYDPNQADAFNVDSFSSNNLISGCSYKLIENNYNSFSRFRMRFRDQTYRFGGSTTDLKLSGMNIVTFPLTQINTAHGRKGNYFVWKDVDIDNRPTEINLGEKDNTILDAFLNVYYFTNTQTTDGIIQSKPIITMMDNLYILDPLTNSNFKMSDLKISMHNVFLKDTNTSPTVFNYISSNYNDFPYFLMLHGSISNTFPSNTFSLKIFFDFIEPIIYENDKVDCSGKGVNILSCDLIKGFTNLKKDTYTKVDGVGENKYSYNPRYANSILINMNFSEIQTTDNFSIIIPFKVTISTFMNELIHITGMNNNLKSLISFQLWDNSFRQIAYYDYSSTNENYNLWIINNSLINTSNGNDINSLKKTNTNVSQYDDNTVNNNSPNGVWLSNNDGKAGSFQNIVIKSNCDNCNEIIVNNDSIFGTLSLCADYNFYSNTDFSINNSSTNNRDKCHTVRYYFNKNKYCLFCPKLRTTTPNNEDNSAQSFQINNFWLPISNGLKYPSNMVGVLSQNYVKSFNSMESLNKVMKPNLAIIKVKRLAVPQNKYSLLINLNFEITNSLKKDQVLILRRISGENILSILGLDQKPPCIITQNLITYKCEYYIITNGIYFLLLEDIPKGQIFLRIYGISSGVVTISSNIRFKFETMISNDVLDLNKIIDSSENNEILEFVYTAQENIGSGNIRIKSINYTSKFYNSYTDIELVIQLIGRNILLNDEIKVNFGASAYNAISDPVWCLIKDAFTKKIWEKPAICIKDNLDQLTVKFNTNLNSKEFILVLYNFKLPSQDTPGIKLIYSFNNGFKAFESEEYPYTNLIDRKPFKVPIIGNNLLKGRGFKNVFNIKITPDFTVEKQDLMFIKFSSDFNPKLSKHPFYVFEKKTNIQLKSWIRNDRTLVVTGWNTSLDGELAYELEIRGIEGPGSMNKRYIQIMIFKEIPNNDFVQWGTVTFGEDLPSINIKFLYQKNLIFSNRIIRTKGSFELEFSYDQELSYFQIVNLFFDNLEQELVRSFNGGCSLFLRNDILKNNMALNCLVMGNNIKLILKNKIAANELIVLRMNDFPNPDYPYCKYLTPQLIISNAVESRILISSTILLNNIDKTPFKNLINTININYQLDNGIIEIPRGFYKNFNIIIDPKHEHRFFQDNLYFSVLNNLNGLILLKYVNYLDFTDFFSKIGNSEKNYSLGVNFNSVLATYFVIILKRETFVTNKYSNLPLLRLRIINKKSSFINKKTIVIYRGSVSLPIYLEPEMIPVDELYFVIEFYKINGVNEEELTIRNNKNAIKLSSNKPIDSFQIDANFNTIKESTKLIVKEQQTNSRFNEFEFDILIKNKNPNLKEKVIVNFREISFYSINIDFTSNTSTYIIYYLSPDYDFINLNKNTIENWIKNGLKNVGDILIGYALINDFIKPETKFIKNLLSQTNYKLRVFYETPETNKKEIIDMDFKTLSKNLKDGEFTINFKQPVFLGFRQRLLCLLCVEYSIPINNLWTDKGLNCDNTVIDNYVLNKINNLEFNINNTIAEINNANKNATNSQNSTKIDLDLIYKPTKFMKVLYFASKRRNEPINIYERLFNDTRKKDSINKFGKIFSNEKIVLNITSFFQSFYTQKPVIYKDNMEKITGNDKIQINNLKTNSTGFFLAVIDLSTKYTSIDASAIKRVNSFKNYIYLNTNRNETFNISFLNLNLNTKYSIFCLSILNDPRKNSLSSEILNITFTTGLTNQNNFYFILKIFISWTILIFN